MYKPNKKPARQKRRFNKELKASEEMGRGLDEIAREHCTICGLTSHITDKCPYGRKF